LNQSVGVDITQTHAQLVNIYIWK